MGFEDIVGLGKAVEKLMDVASKGVGALMEPSLIKRRAKAEGEALKITANAMSESMNENPEGTAMAILTQNPSIELKKIEDFAERAIAARDHRARVEQQTLEDIVGRSVKYLGGTVSEEPVDPDWRTRFFNKAKDVSHDEMREVWSKILAGEVTKPGSFTLRTLETLSNLTQSEAEIFRKISGYATSNGGVIFLPKFLPNSAFTSEISFRDILRLQDAGLLQTKDNLSVSNTISPKSGVGYPYSHGLLTIINESDAAISRSFPVYLLSPAGFELTSLIEASVWTDDYVERLQKIYPFLKIIYSSKV